MAPPPVVTGISPKDGPPGTRVTIRGEFLGTSSTDLIGLKICGCDCLLSAEWNSKNKIVARSGPCKGRGDIIVTTRSGGEGTSTVQFRGYHESVGPVKESAVWVEESAPPALPWGRRPMSPTTYTPPDPLGLSTEGDDIKFPEEELLEMFPDGSGNLSDENFEPYWYLLEHHSTTSYEDLKAGMAYLQRRVESQKEGQLSFLKTNTGAVMDQLDRLVLLKNMFEEDQRKNGKEPLPSLKAAIEESITLADRIFSSILSRKEDADKTREALLLLTRHKFLFQLPASMDRNIKQKEYDLVVNDYIRVKDRFGSTDVKLFQKILEDIDKKIEDLKQKLHSRIQTMPIGIQDQTKFIRLLISLNWEGDAAWKAIASRKEYLVTLLNKVKDHFKQKEEQETGEKGRRKKDSAGAGEWSQYREMWCAASCGVLSDAIGALWKLARWYFAGELGGEPAAANRHEEFKDMIIEGVELFSGHMRACLLGAGGAGAGGAGAGEAEVRARLLANLRSLREAHDALIKLDLPSQPLDIVERVIFDYRVHGMTVFLQRALRRVRALVDKETWRVEEYSDYGAITHLPHLLESHLSSALTSIQSCTAAGARRERALLPAPPAAAGAPSASSAPSAPLAALHAHAQQILLAFVAVLDECKQQQMNNDTDQGFSNYSLSYALGERMEETLPLSADAPGDGPSWQQRLLIAGANAQYTRRVTLANIANEFERHGFPKPTVALQATNDALVNLESNIAELYVEHRGDPLVGTIEQSMYLGVGRHRIERASAVDDVRQYVYEIVHNLIAVHAEVDSVCGSASSRYVREICETVCEELKRLADKQSKDKLTLTKGEEFQAMLEYRILHIACQSYLTPDYHKAAMAGISPLENHEEKKDYLKAAMAGIPPLENQEDKKRMESLISDFQKRMELQLASLNYNLEISV